MGKWKKKRPKVVTDDVLLIGTVAFFNTRKGWGLVESCGEKYFFHFKDIITKRRFKTLNSGQKVVFDIQKTDHKMSKAVRIQAI